MSGPWPLNVTITITTFLPRLAWFKEMFLVTNDIFPSETKIVSIDGWDWDRHAQNKYHEEITAFLDNRRFANTIPLMYPRTTSLASRWNDAIRRSRPCADNYFIMNDDVTLDPAFRRELASAIDENNLACNFGCFNYFMLSGRCVDTIGYFDEGLCGIGEEDGDYEIRICLSGGEVCKYASSNIGPVETQDEKFYTNPLHAERKRRNTEYLLSKYDFIKEPRQDFVYVPIVDQYVRRKRNAETS